MPDPEADAQARYAEHIEAAPAVDGSGDRLLTIEGRLVGRLTYVDGHWRAYAVIAGRLVELPDRLLAEPDDHESADRHGAGAVAQALAEHDLAD